MLINCVAYRDGKRLAEIAKEQISDYLAQPDTFIWVAVKDPSPAELDPDVKPDEHVVSLSASMWW